MSLGVVLSLAQGGAAPKSPAPLDSARLFYQAGDLVKAQQLARGCAQKGSKPCKALVKLLARYAELVRRLDGLGPSEARTLLELDREISPGAPGRLSEKIRERFVAAPLELARHHAAQGNAESARVIAQEVLAVEPSNAEAQRLAAPP